MSDNPLLLPPREVVVVLYPGDIGRETDVLRDEIADGLDAAATAAADRPARPKRMLEEPDEPPARDPEDEVLERLAVEHDEKAEREAERGIKVTLREVSARAYRELQDACDDPREGNRRDAVLGYDGDDFERRLVRAMLVEPEVTDDQFDEFADQAGAYNWAKLVTAAFGLCSRDVDVPKSFAVSALRLARETGRKPSAATE